MARPLLRCRSRRCGAPSFTLLETIVAVAVLALSLIGPMVLAYQSLQSGRVTKEKVTALYLAQDALEFVKSVRDSNVAAQKEWLSGLTSCLGASCTVDTTQSGVALSSVVTSCSGSCSVMRFDAATERYGYNPGWTSTIYTRTMTLTEVVTDREVHANVTVSWSKDGIPGSVSISQNIFRLNDE